MIHRRGDERDAAQMNRYIDSLSVDQLAEANLNAINYALDRWVMRGYLTAEELDAFRGTLAGRTIQEQNEIGKAYFNHITDRTLKAMRTGTSLIGETGGSGLRTSFPALSLTTAAGGE